MDFFLLKNERKKNTDFLFFFVKTMKREKNILKKKSQDIQKIIFIFFKGLVVGRKNFRVVMFVMSGKAKESTGGN